MNRSKHISCRVIGLAVTLALTSAGFAEIPQSKEARPVKITCLHGWTEKPREKRYLDDVAAIFSKNHPDITVMMVGVGVFQQYTMLMSGIAAGEPPDIVFGTSDISRFLALEIPLDLKPWFLADDGAWLKAFRPGIGQMLTHHDGGMYMAPLRLKRLPLNYHKDAIAKSGMPLPKTKKEFYALLDKLKELGYNPPFELHQSMIDEMIDLLVLDYASRDGIDPKALATGKVPFNSQFVIDALENFKELYVKGYLPKNFYSLQGTEGRMKYSTGVMAMKVGFFGDVYTHHGFGMPFENQGVHPFPNMSGAREKWHIGMVGGCFVVRQTKYPEACVEFLKFLTSKEMQKKLVEDTGTEEIGYPMSNRFLSNMSEYASAYAADLEHGTRYTLCSFDPELPEFFQTQIRSLVKGKLGSKELAGKVDELRIRILAQREESRAKKVRE